MICAGSFHSSRDAYAGDSGGPPVAYDLEYPYVAGIVSWGIGCGQKGYFGCYTKVSEFLDWILDRMVQNRILANETNFDSSEFVLNKQMKSQKKKVHVYT